MGMDKNQSYTWRVLIAIDQFCNAVVCGSPDETISSRWGRAMRAQRLYGCVAPWYVRIGCWVLDKIDPGHCEASIEFTEDGKPDPHHFTGER